MHAFEHSRDVSGQLKMTYSDLGNNMNAQNGKWVNRYVYKLY